MSWTDAIPAGTQSESYPVELVGVPTPLTDLWVTIDGGDDAADGVIDECQEADNVATWGGPVCP